MISSSKRVKAGVSRYEISITDYNSLVEIVARIILGRYTSALAIVNNHGNTTIPKKIALKSSLDRLSPGKTRQSKEQRDGFVFQHISWAIGYQEHPMSASTPPHDVPAQKGFDSVRLITKPDGTKIILIIEDKATTNPRSTFKSDVIPEIKNILSGVRDAEITQSLTLILERERSDDIESILDQIVWEESVGFRVSMLTSKDDIKRTDVYDGYKDATPNLDSSRRIGVLMKVDDMRTWIDDFCSEVSKTITKWSKSV